jgi:hypothetical protein
MKKIKWVSAVAVLLTASLPALGAGVAELWETTGLKTPESALPDPTSTFAYVSNVNGEPLAKDGNGFISKVSLADGKITELEWAKGLDGPKGLALVGDKLYVSDIDRLVAIDTGSGKIVAQYPAPGAKFLNDVAADSQGRVYVSDSDTSTIWRLADGKFEKWIDGPELKDPNGLLAKRDKLIAAAWGAPNADGTYAKANLLEINIADKKVRDLGSSAPIGNLDGIEPLSDTSFLVTDWIAGALFIIDAKGNVERLLDLNQGSADIGWLPNERLLLIPMMKDDKLVAYRLK